MSVHHPTRRSLVKGVIAPRSATAFVLSSGQSLTVIDPEGEQVADLVAFNRHDVREAISSGRSIDYAGRIYLSTSDPLYSNRSRPMLRIVADAVGRHDFLLAPCSPEMFRILYDDPDPAPGCFGHLAAVLAPYGVLPDAIPTAFNCFMNVAVDATSGTIQVLPPRSKPGDSVVFQAEMDLIVGLTACSAGLSNNFAFKPIHFRVED